MPLAITTPGLPEMIVIALIFVLLFGAKKLPELGGAIGKSIKSFKKGVEEERDDEPSAEGTAADGSAADGSTPVSRGDGA